MKKKMKVGELLVARCHLDLSIGENHSAGSEEAEEGDFFIFVDEKHYKNGEETYIFLNQKTGSYIYWPKNIFDNTGKPYLEQVF